MSRESRVAAALVAVAVVLGIAADVFFRGRGLGLNVGLFAVVFVGALALLLRVGRAPLHQGRRWMAAPLLVFSFAFVWHDSPLLTIANALAVGGAVAVGALRRTTPARASVADYAEGLAAAGAGALAGTIRLLQHEVPWDELGGAFRRGPTRAVARGLALGLPLLLVFGGLFVAADSVFQHLVTAALPDLPHLWSHVVVVAVVAFFAAGLLRDLVAAKTTLPRPKMLRLGATEVAVALAVLNLLFAGFVAVQAREALGDLTAAQFARRGFFELVAVSLLVLPVVLGANALAPARVTRVLCGILLLLELAVAASALDRLWLDQRQYGLTEPRLYATGIVLWLVCVFIWLGVTTLRAQGRFAVGALVLGFAATAALNAMDPDALIARVNLSRPHVDYAYLMHLSDDAVPTLVAHERSLPPALRRQLRTRALPHIDLLSWNLSRERARRALGSAR
jgi:hypothetical protein